MTGMPLPLEKRTIVDAMRRAVEAVPDQVFIQGNGETLTYGEFDRRAAVIANSLATLGLKRYGKVALMMRNSIEFVVSWIGSAKLGAIYVPINTEYKGDILEHQLGTAEITHIVVDSDLVPRIAEVHARLPLLRAVIVVNGRPDASLYRFAPKIALVAYDQLAAEKAIDPHVPVLYTDPHAISFTSGTTGPSKGVLATHCHTVTFALDWVEACGFQRTDRLYSCLPMFHAIASWLGVLPTMLCQAQTSFGARFSASRFWDEVRRYQATVVHGIFSMIPILLKQPERPDDRDVPARLFYIGQRNRQFEERFNCRIVEVYGATETGIVTYTPLDLPAVHGSCGMANTRTYDVAVVDDQDNGVDVGQVGEIVVRPRQPYSMLQEYYGMQRETLAAFRNLWFHTGDNAWVDAGGYFHFADRKKDAIRRRGENISSFEIERVITADPRVLECAAVAVPSELGEDDVKIVIVCQPGSLLSAQDVWLLCDARMPRFWVPRYLEFRDALPKTPNGKVQKYLLRQPESRSTQFDREHESGAHPEFA